MLHKTSSSLTPKQRTPDHTQHLENTTQTDALQLLQTGAVALGGLTVVATGMRAVITSPICLISIGTLCYQHADFIRQSYLGLFSKENPQTGLGSKNFQTVQHDLSNKIHDLTHLNDTQESQTSGFFQNEIVRTLKATDQNATTLLLQIAQFIQNSTLPSKEELLEKIGKGLISFTAGIYISMTFLHSVLTNPLTIALMAGVGYHYAKPVIDWYSADQLEENKAPQPTKVQSKKVPQAQAQAQAYQISNADIELLEQTFDQPFNPSAYHLTETVENQRPRVFIPREHHQS